MLGKVNSSCQIPDNNAVEMGANWVHGEEDNVVHRMASAAGEINTDLHTMQSSGLEDNVVFAFENEKITDAHKQEVFGLIENIRENSVEELAAWDKSYGEYFNLK